MSEIIKKLHKDSLAERGCKEKISWQTKEAISSLFKEKEGKMDEKDFEHYQEEVFFAASEAEENGFIDGFKYAFRLFSECMGE